MKLKSYRLKEGTTKEMLEQYGCKPGGVWINEESKCFISKYLVNKSLGFDVTINIAFLEDINNWNDFDNILVLDEYFGQPYTHFYDDRYYKKDVHGFRALEWVIIEYNKFMNSLPFIEECMDDLTPLEDIEDEEI